MSVVTPSAYWLYFLQVSRQSHNQELPYTPAHGMESAFFALNFKVGPERYPFDKVAGYQIIQVRKRFV
jgi:hypothetical protein